MDKKKRNILTISAVALIMLYYIAGKNVTYMVMIMVVLFLKIIIHYKKGVVLFSGKKEMMELKH